MSEGTCQFCGRPTATDICPAHGFVGKARPPEVETIPLGLISMWSGTIATIPAKWALCDGANGTPDLRDKFVMGGGTTAPGAKGGSNAHAHSTTVTGGGGGTSGAGTSHAHSGGAVTSVSMNTSSDGDHNHGYYSGNTGTADSYNSNPRGTSTDINYTNQNHYHQNNHTHADSGDHYHPMSHGHTFTDAGAEASHTHSVTAYGGGTFSSSGVIGVAYYTLAFIMKVG